MSIDGGTRTRREVPVDPKPASWALSFGQPLVKHRMAYSYSAGESGWSVRRYQRHLVVL